MVAKETIPNDIENTTLKIKEEQLDITKKRIQTCEVKIYKETITEEKTFTIPISREELVIEKTPLTPTSDNNIATSIETIRIPLNEEQVDFTKHTVTLEDVSIHNEQIKDIKHIEEIIKREKANVNWQPYDFS